MIHQNFQASLFIGHSHSLQKREGILCEMPIHLKILKEKAMLRMLPMSKKQP